MQVEYIFQQEIDTDDPILHELNKYCKLRNIVVKVRLFDPVKSEYDRRNITKLPAFHVYKKKQYYDTYYPDERSVQLIHLIYNKFELQELEYLAKKQIWDERLKYIKRLFRKGSLKTDSQSSKNNI